MMNKRWMAAGLAAAMILGFTTTAAAAGTSDTGSVMRGSRLRQQTQQEMTGENRPGQSQGMSPMTAQGSRNDMQQPPEKPEGELTDENRPEPPEQGMGPMTGQDGSDGMQQPPEKPEGETTDENRPEPPQGNAPSAQNSQGVFDEFGCSLMERLNLPVRELLARTGVKRKLIDSHRKYLLAAILVKTGDYQGISEYIV